MTDSLEGQGETDHPVIALERAALARWAQGDPGGFIDLATDDIVYFDPFLECRLDGKEAFVSLMEKIRGAFRIDAFELRKPIVQAVPGLAVLTFNFVSTVGEDTHRWNATEVYREEAGLWRLVHQHWSIPKAPPADGEPPFVPEGQPDM